MVKYIKHYPTGIGSGQLVILCLIRFQHIWRENVMVCVCAYMCMCIYVYVHICVCAYMCMCIYVYVHICICVLSVCGCM